MADKADSTSATACEYIDTFKLTSPQLAQGGDLFKIIDSLHQLEKLEDIQIIEKYLLGYPDPLVNSELS